MEIKKIIIATESQHSWTPDKSLELNNQQINELKQYLPTPQQSVDLLHSVSLAASKHGIDVEHLVIEDIDNSIEKIRISATNESCVWIVSDGRIFHRSGPICAWLKNVNIKVFGIDTTIQSLTDNKYLMTVIAEKHGIQVPTTMLYKGSGKLAEISGSNPGQGYFVKPNTLGSQVGISSKSRFEDLSQAIKACVILQEQYGVDAIVQAYIAGKDYRVAVIEQEESKLHFGCFEVNIVNKYNQKQDFSTNRTESDRKWNLTQVTDQNKAVYLTAENIVHQFKNLGLIRGYSGLDLRGSDTGGYCFLENNVKPFVDLSFQSLATELGYSSNGEMFVDAILRRYKCHFQLFR